ncbi:MAG TPA: FkbM family methyltransferase [Thermoanaerobaculia bacterium]|nr:FkbM family methyltransferase [Thermoanaerobaculia bacterium]
MESSIFLERLRARIRRQLFPRGQPASPTLEVVSYRGARFLVWSHEDVGWRLVRDRSFEPAELEALRQRIRPDDICVDIGANIGIFTVLMARWAPQGHVHAFEPMEHSASVLRLNLELNAIANATLYTEVLSDQVGEVSFAVAEDGAYSSLRHTARKAQQQTVVVRSNRLDSFILALESPPDVLKIDVEGAELLVLRGAAETLRDERRRPRMILAEAHESNSRAYGYTPADLVGFMRAAGYLVQAILPDGQLTDWPAPAALPDILFVAPDPR